MNTDPATGERVSAQPQSQSHAGRRSAKVTSVSCTISSPTPKPGQTPCQPRVRYAPSASNSHITPDARYNFLGTGHLAALCPKLSAHLPSRSNLSRDLSTPDLPATSTSIHSPPSPTSLQPKPYHHLTPPQCASSKSAATTTMMSTSPTAAPRALSAPLTNTSVPPRRCGAPHASLCASAPRSLKYHTQARRLPPRPCHTYHRLRSPIPRRHLRLTRRAFPSRRAAGLRFHLRSPSPFLSSRLLRRRLHLRPHHHPRLCHTTIIRRRLHHSQGCTTFKFRRGAASRTIVITGMSGGRCGMSGITLRQGPREGIITSTGMWMGRRSGSMRGTRDGTGVGVVGGGTTKNGLR
ncbi:hypothetical protein EJ06DRAFT_578715 [Trichodelitschia bisporula]|uniref:Uncharacterized protein n=1 Tax=Trichodelitschia bisporula TaxID=703511 RepID=A0A6G1IC06_9PEZI|nr:hypothetical protein EJ06DRAFT_578715 [Trichodelitschia bisporula]